MQRLNYFPQIPEAVQKMTELEAVVKKTSIDKELYHLIKIRASLLNGCGLCYDMHIKEAKIHGVSTLKLFHLGIWQESQMFSPKERAALEWTDAVTRLSQGPVSDEAFAKVRELYSDKEITELTLIIGLINLWNRFGASFLTPPGAMDKVMGLEKAGL